VRAISLGYHDIVERQTSATDGVRSCPHQYALERSAFLEHLRGIDARAGSAVSTITEYCQSRLQLPVFLTFDDGASSAHSCIAPDLERFGWRGHFFVVSDWIGTPAFLTANQIRDLDERGHIIGSHSCSHPERMSKIGRNAMSQEWRDSCAALSDVLGKAVRIASIPNGYYSRAVAETAAEAGIEALFTSEPISRTFSVDGCLILGRYSIKSNGRLSLSGEIAAGDAWPRAQQFASFGLMKVAKAVGGETYLGVRKAILSSFSAGAKR
jgi:hypothetical protein